MSKVKPWVHNQEDDPMSAFSEYFDAIEIFNL